ncbi:AAA family ATPase [Pararhizobium mangrovi]|nr:CpaE family protein [Pararhizobium mangrovi]
MRVDEIRPLPRISVQAFCESEGLFRTIERCGQDRRMAKVNLRVTHGGIQAAVSMFETAPTPNLILLEVTAQPKDVMETLAPLADVCDPTTKVVLVGHFNDIALYRELVRNGISEYLVAPVSLADVLACIATIFVDPEAEPLGRSIAFVGAKGGVGSSTIAHNCAFGISDLFETETVLADLDLAFGTASIDFDRDPPQGIAEAVHSPDRLDEVFLDRLLARCSDNLSLLAAPSLLDRTYDFKSDSFAPLVEILRRNAPVSILDVPHGWSEWHRSVLGEADEIVVTAVPDLANLRNTKNLFDALAKLRPDDRPPHLVLNQVGVPKRPEIGPDDFCEPLGVQPVALVPFDSQLFGSAANSGRMIAEMSPKSTTSETFSQLAHILTGRIEAHRPRRGGLAGIMQRLARK